AAARAFAAELLADGARDPDNARTRVQHGAHPDLTWVTPSGAHEMLRSDVDDAVVTAASHTPFEANRRVFVLERADTMNDEAANTLLKTLEEPPSYVVLLLLTDRPGQVLPTIASRCQTVRFDPAPPERIAAGLTGVPDATALACARLSLGDADRAALLATPAGAALRASAESLAREGEWRAILQAGVARAAIVRVELELARDEELQFLPKKDQRRRTSEYDDRIKRAERRARTGAVDHALQLAGLWLRDVSCVAAGAPDLAHNADRVDALAAEAAGRTTAALREAMDLVEDTRARFALNVSEDLALEALSFRLQRTLARA
ncbi:MAG: polymerase subunit delta, partial [Solirubrobacteraceae bacterium]|nr:polymerase subunit delta [Solirubrobacteraceae bacterium]